MQLKKFFFIFFICILGLNFIQIASKTSKIGNKNQLTLSSIPSAPFDAVNTISLIRDLIPVLLERDKFIASGCVTVIDSEPQYHVNTLHHFWSTMSLVAHKKTKFQMKMFSSVFESISDQSALNRKGRAVRCNKLRFRRGGVKRKVLAILKQGKYFNNSRCRNKMPFIHGAVYLHPNMVPKDIYRRINKQGRMDCRKNNKRQRHHSFDDDTFRSEEER